MTDTQTLTIGERIVVHLSQYGRVQDEFVVPPEMAQTGIAHSLGISRAHAAIELRRQMDAGRVVVRIGHVAGMPSRRKVYRLTPNGEGIARSLRNRALARTVAIMFEDGRVESLPGPQALEALRRRGVAEGRSVLLILTRGRIDLRQPGLRRAPLPPPHGRVLSAEARARAAFDAAFVRPYAWQLEVVLGPPHVPPVAVAA